MAITEKAAYLKGLYDGLGLSEESTKEAKMLGAIVDVLQELALRVDENEESISTLDDEVYDLFEALDNQEDDEDEDDGEGFHDLYEDEDDEELELELPAEIPCPACGEDVLITPDDLAEGVKECPHCGKELQIELEAEDDEEELSF